ncbi:ADP-ribose pyrophosphatase YjhB (NUDIX family) [Neolewinella xylanilytica]|uniref:ADP-ribose pyrophosphatase YjhB (NUDIX family) n=1 Tax=Neolewinella xylanilytica TaxID=1514080 RepID=A0A2S6I5W7_9BACT|nr:NUDIX hydrolase [Neolewinella xylanilytica]PPK86501.1 ADP-ribose pyrophosphatase YjhB (NUDIX family) [Neolewinella xylanilytica]
MNFCSHCGSADLQFRIPDQDNQPRFVCDNCHTIHYQNPKMVTGCLPVWEDRVLLCRRAIAPAYGLWNVPSGYLENGESVADGARREVREEAAAEVTIDYLITVYDLEKVNQVYLQFVGELAGGRYGIGPESLESRLFREEEIPWKDIAFTSSAYTLRAYFANRKSGEQLLHRGSFPETAPPQ